MPDIGGWEWVIIAVVALVLFGGTKLASVGKNAGRAIREFKEEVASPTSEAKATGPRPAPVVEQQAISPVADPAPVVDAVTVEEAPVPAHAADTP